MSGTFSQETLAEALGALDALLAKAEALSALLEDEGVLVGDDWLTIEEAIEFAGVSRSKLYHWMRHERLPFFDGGDRQIRRSALLQFKRDKEVVMVRDKKVPAQRASQRTRPTGDAKKQKIVRKAPKAKSPRGRAAAGAMTKKALLAHLDSARKAA